MVDPRESDEGGDGGDDDEGDLSSEVNLYSAKYLFLKCLGAPVAAAAASRGRLTAPLGDEGASSGLEEPDWRAVTGAAAATAAPPAGLATTAGAVGAAAARVFSPARCNCCNFSACCILKKSWYLRKTFLFRSSIVLLREMSYQSLGFFSAFGP